MLQILTGVSLHQPTAISERLRKQKVRAVVTERSVLIAYTHSVRLGHDAARINAGIHSTPEALPDIESRLDDQMDHVMRCDIAVGGEDPADFATVWPCDIDPVAI